MLLPVTPSLGPTRGRRSGRDADGGAADRPSQSRSGPVREAPREPLALAYAGNPDKKGLDIALGAWAAAAPAGWRLLVTGIERRSRAPLPARARHRGAGRRRMGRDRRAGALPRAARACERVFLAASRYEDYGHRAARGTGSGLPAGDGAVGRPVRGAGAARELDPALVADDMSGGRAGRVAARAPVRWGRQERSRLRRVRAREGLRPYSRRRSRPPAEKVDARAVGVATAS